MSDQIGKLMTQIVLTEAERDIARDRAAKAETAQRAWTEIGARAEAGAAAWLGFVGEAYQRAVDGNAPGAALLAELEAARAVIEVARTAVNGTLFEARGALVHALAEYEWAIQKARTG